MNLELAIYVFITMFFAFIVKGIAGFGDPLISSPILALRIDNNIITPSNSILNLIFNAYMTFKNRKSFSVKAVLPMLIAVVCGIIPGALLLKYADALWLKACLGALIVFLGIEMMTRNKSKKFKGNTLIMLLVSFASGFTSGLYGINLFIVAYLERSSGDRSAFRGQMGFLFFIDNIFRIFIYIIAGIYTKDIMILSLVSLPGALLGFYAGSKFDMKLSETTVKRIVYVVFIIAGLNTFIQSVF